MLHVSHVVKHYDAVAAVRDVSFDIAENEIVGLIGPNGAGKSTVLAMITGYLSPDSGSVTVCGHDTITDSIAARMNIGYIPEFPPLYPDMTVAEYISFCARLKKVSKKNVASECDRLINEFELTEVRNRLTGLLSKGFKQRTSFAAALAGDPKVLVFDEMTSGLDPRQIVSMRDSIERRAKGHAMLLCSHHLEDIQEICTRLLIMNNGTIIAAGTMEQLQEKWGTTSLESIFLKATGA